MRIKSIILGIATTSVLITVLVATRMMLLTSVDPEYEIREVETVTLPEPPPPAPEETVEDEPPPPPAIADLAPVLDISQPAIPIVSIKVDPRIAVDTFYTDQPPSPLPKPVVKRPVKKSAPKIKAPVRKPSKPRAKPSPPKTKSQYSVSELDRKPRLLRNPSVRFPSGIRNATSGRVVVKVAILPSGKSQFISVISSTHPALIPAARRIASGSRFTAPTRQGRAVKAIMTWPIIIKK